MERRLWYIKNAEFFSWLAEEEQQQLARRTEMVSCRRNCQLFFHDDPSDYIYLVKEGKVKLTRTSPEGLEIILDILGPDRQSVRQQPFLCCRDLRSARE